MSSAPSISVNAGAAPWAAALRAQAGRLEVGVATGALGETVIDAGAERRGGIEAGLAIARICLGGLGEVTLAPPRRLSRMEAPPRRRRLFPQARPREPPCACAAMRRTAASSVSTSSCVL